jgi:hypothetical protein
MKIHAFRGSTAFEIQLGSVWVRVLRPRFWCRRNLGRFLQVGWDGTSR